MLRKNIPGAVLILLIVFSFVATGFYLGLKLDWQSYFKILSIVAVVALIVSAIINTVPAGNNNK